MSVVLFIAATGLSGMKALLSPLLQGGDESVKETDLPKGYLVSSWWG